MLDCKAICHRSGHSPRTLRLESLETRAMLSHPAVTAVNVASTNWAPDFVSYLESHSLGAGGYAIPSGSSAQLQTLPWTNINQVRITFSEDVIIQAADLSISGVNATALTFSGFLYNSTTHTAVWTLSAPITKDKLLLDLDGDGMDPVRSVSTGDILTGEWTDCVSTFPSGNEQDVSDFQFRINAIPGDADGSNYVTLTDALLVRSKIGRTVNCLDYNPRYDLDASGLISSTDYSIALSKIGSMLPTGNPAGMTNDAPTTAGIPDLFFDTTVFDDLMLASDSSAEVVPDTVITAAAVDQVLSQPDAVSDISTPRTLELDENSENNVVSLPALFADLETSSEDMTYSIVGNTNPSIFDSLTIDESGQLTIDVADNADGESVLTIRATDAGGLIVETSFTVHASNSPYISNFECINTVGDYWTLTGIVTDNDDSVEGFVVSFGGVLASYNLTATVDDVDGAFTLTVAIPNLTEGTATAQTKDPQGIESNLAMYWMVV